MTSRPPSFPPARSDAERAVTSIPPSFRPADPDAAPPVTSRPPAVPTQRPRRGRTLGTLLACLAVLIAFHFSGFAPWARAIPAADALDPSLERAIGRAVAAAAEDGIELRVTSGLRSVAEQRALWDDAVDQYGGPHEAARWVLPPEHSEHVRGRAVDVGPAEGAQWLADNGSRWGLCQVFANEPWHFERLTGKNGTCPELLPDASVLLDLD